jgi:hypothetical protein
MNLHIRLAKPSDLKNYIDLLQITYEFAYTNPKIGLTKDCFSPEIFDTELKFLSKQPFRSQLESCIDFIINRKY